MVPAAAAGITVHPAAPRQGVALLVISKNGTKREVNAKTDLTGRKLRG